MSTEEKAARRTQEYSLVRRFIQAAERKLDQIQARGDAKTFQLEPDEMKALLAINNHGLLEGAAAGIVSFILLRRIRTSLLARLQRQTTGTSPTGTPAAAPHAPRSPFQQIKPPNTTEPASSATPSIPEQVLQRRSSGASGAAYNLISWIIDATVSFYIAVYVSVRNPDDLLHQVADLPLVPGRSRLASELCPEFLAELQSLQTERDGTLHDALQNPQTPLLRAFLRICHNCQQRAAYEKLLRQELGLGPDAVVTIPLPGVPHKVIPHELSRGAWDNGTALSSEFFEDESSEMNGAEDWSESMVLDQEEQARRESQGRQGRN